MRLEEFAVDAILASVKRFTQGVPFDVYLHGSRLDDTLKGGDIDLFIVVPQEQVETLSKRKHYLLSAIKSEIGQQRLDVTICSSHSSFFLNSEKIQLSS